MENGYSNDFFFSISVERKKELWKKQLHSSVIHSPTSMKIRFGGKKRDIMNHEEARKGGKKSKVPTEALNYAEDSDLSESRAENGHFIHPLSPHEQAQAYLKDHKIYELFNFLIGHLLVDEPDDPIEYLGNLLDKCMLFKSGIEEPPLLFTNRHIDSLFQSMDPSSTGKITLEQYKNGMKTLKISHYDQRPVECTPGYVDRETFKEEAKKCLVESLAEIVGRLD